MISDYSKYNELNENLSIDPTRKEIYGEINTPFSFIEEMYDALPQHLFENPELRWLDAGSGSGNFSIVLYFRLMKCLATAIENPAIRSKHIIKNMLFMAEINEINVKNLKQLFGKDANIYYGDFLQMSLQQSIPTPNVIVGNPPFNVNGLAKVPTNSKRSKKNDGQTSWTHFVRASISLLAPSGFLNIIIPSIWMKPDKEKIYNLLTSYKIHKIKCLSNSETNKLFSYGAQTPTCYFALQKIESDSTLNIYDSTKRDFLKIKINKNMPIALNGWSILQKILPFCEKYGRLSEIVQKTNMPPLKTNLSIDQHPISFPYSNIHSCHIKNQTTPELLLRYSNIQLPFASHPKLVLAHKMYGFPYVDFEGKYGISNRDNYVILNKTHDEMRKLQQGLNNKIMLFVMTTTRYRMKYLEKYAFYYMPDFSKMESISEDFYDKVKLTQQEWKIVEEEIKKNYDFFNKGYFF
jgi:hypothetical protein